MSSSARSCRPAATCTSPSEEGPAMTAWLVGARDEEVLDVSYGITAKSRAAAIAIVSTPRVPRNLTQCYEHSIILVSRELLWVAEYVPLRDDRRDLSGGRWPLPPAVPGDRYFEVFVREEVRCERVFKVEAATPEEAGALVLASDPRVGLHRYAENTETLLTCEVLQVEELPMPKRRGVTRDEDAP